MGQKESVAAREALVDVQDFEEKYFQETYTSYSKASMRRVDPLIDSVHSPYDPNGYRAILTLIPGVIRLLTILAAPYFFLLACFVLLTYIFFEGSVYVVLEAVHESSVLIVVIVALLFYGSALLIYFYYPGQSPIREGEQGENPFGAYLRPGLYHSTKSATINNIINDCPLLTSPEARRAALPIFDEKGRQTDTLEPTPWIFTGDMRTIFPFLAFSPPKAAYIRRWVRVPLADGPLCDMVHTDAISKYEAVALDWLPPKDTAPNKEKSKEMAVLLLAGLTGGSEEGYILDLVNTIHKRGWHAFVMLGRGLGGTPCASDAFFHGARTVDLQATAKVVRTCLPAETKICVAGISMGGIIVVNAFAKGHLNGLADCGLSIGGTFDTHRNRYFKHSRDVWQPVLSQGLKEAFAAQPGCMRRMSSRLGPKARITLDEIANVSDFDLKVIKPLNRFRNQEHYYVDMSPPINEYKNFKTPFLTLHAAEDPILHVDSIPVEMAQKGEITPNFIALITETGGHVGWPIGWAPWRYRWHFQNSIVMEFCESIVKHCVSAAAGIEKNEAKERLLDGVKDMDREKERSGSNITQRRQPQPSSATTRA